MRSLLFVQMRDLGQRSNLDFLRFPDRPEPGQFFPVPRKADHADVHPSVVKAGFMVYSL